MSELLSVPGPRWAQVASGAGLVAVLLSLAVVVARADVAGVMLFLLVLGGAALLRWSRLHGGLQALILLVLLASGWAGLLSWYEQVAWLDLVAHTVTTGLLAALTAALLEQFGLVTLLDSGARRGRAGTVVVVTALGLALAVLWEVGEWAGHTGVDSGINVGYEDTLGDLVAGGLGSGLAGLAYSRRWLRRYPAASGR